MFRVVLFICVGWLALSVPAVGQISPSASGFSDAPTEASASEYWLMMNELGACLAMQKGSQATAFIDTDIGSDEEAESFRTLFHAQRNPCLGNFVTAAMVRAHVRGVVAEGLFERLPDNTVAAFVSAPRPGPETIVSLHDFAGCYVSAQPEIARNLLRQTRVATKGEAQYVGSIAKDFAPCLPSGTTLKLRPTSVRMAIAEALFRGATGRGAARMQGAD